MDNKLICKKCGAQLHEDQKVCIQCSTRTVAGGGFDYGPGPWRPTKKMIYAAAGVLALIVLAIILNSLKVTPPDQIAQKWLDNLISRRSSQAMSYMTPNALQGLNNDGGGISLAIGALADDVYTATVQESAKPTLDAPAMKDQTHATVVITLAYPDGQQKMTITLEMLKDGRKWLIDKVVKLG